MSTQNNESSPEVFTCKRCGGTGTREAFLSDPSLKHGIRMLCKQCHRNRKRRRPGGGALRRRSGERRHPQAREYRRRKQRVYDAVRRGQIVRPNHCQVCGEICIPQGHHLSEADFHLLWVCPRCHARFHRRSRAYRWVDDGNGRQHIAR